MNIKEELGFIQMWFDTMSKRAEDAALKALPDYSPDGKTKVDLTLDRLLYQHGYEQAEQDIITLIESRIAEIMGDAQPTPVLRIELRELIKRIKKEMKEEKHSGAV